MKTSELRIGNLVLDEYLEEWYVVRITKWRVYLSASGDDDESTKCLKLDEITPIVLTEKWLLKMGFDVNNRPDWIDQLNKYEIICGTTSYLKGAENSVFPIKYVHQLQNLYYDLTGKELTI